MGTYMCLTTSQFLIEASAREGALQALKTLARGENAMSGGAHTGERWFAFCNGANPAAWHQLPEALYELRWQCSVDRQGNIDGIDFRGEKLGDDFKIFNALAPYVQPGSSKYSSMARPGRGYSTTSAQ
jgi:hypothetical protein